jgi:hypothetical protein
LLKQWLQRRLGSDFDGRQTSDETIVGIIGGFWSATVVIGHQMSDEPAAI